jgi:hypothetical protein
MVMLEGGNRGQPAPTGRGGVRPAASSRSSTPNGRLATAPRRGTACSRRCGAVAVLATATTSTHLASDCGPNPEGAYVAPLACHQSSAVKFVITVGAVGVTQR